MTLDALAGTPPDTPPWGSEELQRNPLLRERFEEHPAARSQLAVVIGACGALGPDLVDSLMHRGHPVVGVDLLATYTLPGVVYRRVDVRQADSVRRFFDELSSVAEGMTVYDLSAIQTSPSASRGRDALVHGKRVLLDALCELPHDVRLFYMSTAEVYGAPPGAPYAEDCAKAPFNSYGRAKLAEEELMLDADGRATRRGRLRSVALRTWTISMVSYDAAGEIAAARNFNDPLIAVAHRLALAGVRVPLAAPEALCQFHCVEDVCELAVVLADRPLSSPTWGRAFNCIGLPASHAQLRDQLFELFATGGQAAPWWAAIARRALGSKTLPPWLLGSVASSLEALGGALGARDVAGRLPFLFRATHMDSTAVRSAVGRELREPHGASTLEATRRLITGISRGGPDAINERRYRLY